MTAVPLCGNGLHEMTPENTYVKPGEGTRECRPCKVGRHDRWRAENADHVREWRREYQVANRARNLARNRVRRREVKLEVLNAYGGCRCACCGETEIAFLTLDHIDGGGNEHRRQIGSSRAGGDSTYRWLRRNAYPPGYQVLCANCNMAKHTNGGTCPHQAALLRQDGGT